MGVDDDIKVLCYLVYQIWFEFSFRNKSIYVRIPYHHPDLCPRVAKIQSVQNLVQDRSETRM